MPGIRCCCDGQPGVDPCIPRDKNLAGCDDAVICLRKMWKAVTFEFADHTDEFGTCFYSLWSGTYLFPPNDGYSGSYTGPDFSDMLEALPHMGIGCDTFLYSNVLDCQPHSGDVYATWGLYHGLDCYGGEIHATWGLSSTLVDLDQGWYTASGCVGQGVTGACGTDPLPINVAGGYSISADEFSICSPVLDAPCGYRPCLVAASARYFGTPCGSGETCLDPPSAVFSLVPIGGCEFRIVNAAASPNCEMVNCYWSDGNQEGCTRTLFKPKAGCGAQSGELTQFVEDSRGCVAEYTVSWECCNCVDGAGENCGAGSCACNGEGQVIAGVASVSQDGCQITITASGNCGGISICGIGNGTAESHCLCPDKTDEENWLCGGCNYIEAGGSDTFTICGTVNLTAVVSESQCGCTNDPIDLGEFECEACGCCIGCMQGMIMTISGFGDGVCNCAIANQDYLPRPMATGGEFECFSDSDPVVYHVTLCTGDGEATDLSIDLNWIITCLPDELDVPQYYLRVGFDLTHTSGNPNLENSGDWDIYLGTVKPACLAVSGCHTFLFPSYPTTLCNETALEVCAEAY